MPDQEGSDWSQIASWGEYRSLIDNLLWEHRHGYIDAKKVGDEIAEWLRKNAEPLAAIAYPIRGAGIVSNQKKEMAVKTIRIVSAYLFYGRR